MFGTSKKQMSLFKALDFSLLIRFTFGLYQRPILFDLVARQMLFKGLWFATGLFWTSPLGGADRFAPLSKRKDIVEQCKMHLERWYCPRHKFNKYARKLRILPRARSSWHGNLTLIEHAFLGMCKRPLWKTPLLWVLPRCRICRCPIEEGEHVVIGARQGKSPSRVAMSS
jgi:hypothetical protein